jgi:hypothetical protein
VQRVGISPARASQPAEQSCCLLKVLPSEQSKGHELELLLHEWLRRTGV